MKKVAFYLPQYHCFPENDQWWGKGFTEWSNVRKSKPQFKGHHQPEVPYNKNYYNLLNQSFQKEQADLALSYGINCFCYYHYWFDGKLLMQKPVENMLQNKEIKMPFMFCWANESWTRAWDGKTNSLLIKQNANETDEMWEDHFNYLLPYFKDSRYEKISNKPVFIIYKPQLINHCNDMMNLFDRLARKNGFDGIFWGWQHPSANNEYIKNMFDFGIAFEPAYTISEIEKKYEMEKKINKIKYGIRHVDWFYWEAKHILFNKPLIYIYDDVWKEIINRDNDQRIYPGAFPAWDNTPRRGNNSQILYGANTEKFSIYFKKLMAKTRASYPYIFINAWNEWGEGAHLEPDELNGFGFLNAVKNSNGMEG